MAREKHVVPDGWRAIVETRGADAESADLHPILAGLGDSSPHQKVGVARAIDARCGDHGIFTAEAMNTHVLAHFKTSVRNIDVVFTDDRGACGEIEGYVLRENTHGSVLRINRFDGTGQDGTGHNGKRAHRVAIALR